ncbi:MAG: hypothetical protein MUF24_11875 [Chitinophagaceae bacterium]|nr:hypothetical protein [Chitinophagaceae bacterium]
MVIEVEIEFDQLVKLAKKLPVNQWAKLKREVDKDPILTSKQAELENFLLTAPTFTNKQLKEIEKTRNAINQWRTK